MWILKTLTNAMSLSFSGVTVLWMGVGQGGATACEEQQDPILGTDLRQRRCLDRALIEPDRTRSDKNLKVAWRALAAYVDEILKM